MSLADYEILGEESLSFSGFGLALGQFTAVPREFVRLFGMPIESDYERDDTGFSSTGVYFFRDISDPRNVVVVYDIQKSMRTTYEEVWKSRTVTKFRINASSAAALGKFEKWLAKVMPRADVEILSIIPEDKKLPVGARASTTWEGRFSFVDVNSQFKALEIAPKTKRGEVFAGDDDDDNDKDDKKEKKSKKYDEEEESPPRRKFKRFTPFDIFEAQKLGRGSVERQISFVPKEIIKTFGQPNFDLSSGSSGTGAMFFVNVANRNQIFIIEDEESYVEPELVTKEQWEVQKNDMWLSRSDAMKSFKLEVVNGDMMDALDFVEWMYGTNMAAFKYDRPRYEMSKMEAFAQRQRERERR